jgi:hypothetical protein
VLIAPGAKPSTQRRGRLPWESLGSPSINLCRAVQKPLWSCQRGGGQPQRPFSARRPLRHRKGKKRRGVGPEGLSRAGRPRTSSTAERGVRAAAPTLTVGSSFFRRSRRTVTRETPRNAAVRSSSHSSSVGLSLGVLGTFASSDWRAPETTKAGSPHLLCTSGDVGLRRRCPSHQWWRGGLRTISSSAVGSTHVRLTGADWRLVPPDSATAEIRMPDLSRAAGSGRVRPSPVGAPVVVPGREGRGRTPDRRSAGGQVRRAAWASRDGSARQAPGPRRAARRRPPLRDPRMRPGPAPKLGACRWLNTTWGSVPGVAARSALRTTARNALCAPRRVRHSTQAPTAGSEAGSHRGPAPSHTEPAAGDLRAGQPSGGRRRYAPGRTCLRLSGSHAGLGPRQRP